MIKVKQVIKNSLLSLMIAVQVVFYPAITHAQVDPSSTDPTATTDTTTQTVEPVVEPTAPTPQPDSSSFTEPTAPTTTGPTTPTGAESTAYHYNEATGMWENDYYIWDPVTKKTTPKEPQTYSFNPDTGRWETTDWMYDAPTGKYVPNTYATEPQTSTATTQSALTPLGASGAGGGTQLGVANTGPGSDTDITLSNTGDYFFDTFFNANISHTLNSTATSGDASVLQNTYGGNAKTGDAAAIANVINMLQSTWGAQLGDNLATFNADLNGNIFGDLFLNLNNIAGNLDIAANNDTDVDINYAVDARIDNNINLDALSGDATVSENTNGGDATTGDATAIANVVNMINSAIATGQSFMGSININGSLDGDILLPPGLLEFLIANTGPNSNTDISSNNNFDLDANLTNNQVINNTVTTTATSGNASVTQNTIGGNATSGDAETNVTILNLTGRQVVADNALLVFVNVLGQWVGLIMDAPTGSNAALLASNLSGDTNVDLNNNTDIDINSTNNSLINNNITARATSGDATVSRNTNGGNATSGDATASVNIANIINSQLSLADWFGVLFINVFGTWNGSFGVDTAAGNKPKPAPTVAQVKEALKNPENVQVFQMSPKQGNTYKVASAGASDKKFVGEAQIKAATADTDVQDPPANNFAASSQQSSGSSWFPLVTSFAGVAMLGGERFVTLRQRRKS